MKNWLSVAQTPLDCWFFFWQTYASFSRAQRRLRLSLYNFFVIFTLLSLLWDLLKSVHIFATFMFWLMTFQCLFPLSSHCLMWNCDLWFWLIASSFLCVMWYLTFICFIEQLWSMWFALNFDLLIESFCGSICGIRWIQNSQTTKSIQFTKHFTTILLTISSQKLSNPYHKYLILRINWAWM